MVGVNKTAWDSTTVKEEGFIRSRFGDIRRLVKNVIYIIENVNPAENPKDGKVVFLFLYATMK